MPFVALNKPSEGVLLKLATLKGICNIVAACSSITEAMGLVKYEENPSLLARTMVISSRRYGASFSVYYNHSNPIYSSSKSNTCQPSDTFIS